MPRYLRPAVWGCSAILVWAALWYTGGAGPQGRIVAGAVTFLVCCWGFRLVGDGVAALLFFLTLAVSRAVDPETIFQGFTTPAFWLVFSGLVIGGAIQASGLSHRMAMSFRVRGKASYSTLLMRIIVASVLFSFLVPSAMGRVIILLPILKDIAADSGFDVGDNGYMAILLSGVMGTTLLPFSILSANLSNLILSGAASTLFNIQIGYMEFLLLHFPVLGICKAAVLWAIIRFVLPAEIQNQQMPEAHRKWAFEERYTFGVLCVALALWMLDSLHGISPGWVGMAVAVMLLFPVPGLKDANLLGQVRMDTLLFIACAIGVGSVIRGSGLGHFITANFLHLLPLGPEGGVGNSSMILSLFMATGLFTSLPGIPSLFAPLSGEIAHAAHIPLFSLLMIQVLAYSTVILPYQAPPFIVAGHVGRLSYRVMLVCCLLLAAATLLILFPLDWAWWNFMGIVLTT
ncbi:MAG: SLC13 family permease [Desulfovibrio sp.]|uniref:SLC13 family permease n=1 Tax=Desulfovibrio sp. 7SRBS1 TaxID=3378064 RepID=UPI003B3F6243